MKIGSQLAHVALHVAPVGYSVLGRIFPRNGHGPFQDDGFFTALEVQLKPIIEVGSIERYIERVCEFRGERGPLVALKHVVEVLRMGVCAEVSLHRHQIKPKRVGMFWIRETEFYAVISDAVRNVDTAGLDHSQNTRGKGIILVSCRAGSKLLKMRLIE